MAAITLETAVSAGRVTDVGMGNLASSEPHVQSGRIGSNSRFDGHGTWIAATQPSARVQSQTGAVALNAGEVVGSLSTGRVRLDECLVGSHHRAPDRVRLISTLDELFGHGGPHRGALDVDGTRVGRDRGEHPRMFHRVVIGPVAAHGETGNGAMLA